jgi:hypothetical protein
VTDVVPWQSLRYLAVGTLTHLTHMMMMAGDVVEWSRVNGWCQGLLTVLK